jgi:nucleotide-binding universal stress UspA family protein
MIEFKTIGLAIAFSPTAPAMLAEARRLVVYFKAKLVLIHVGEHNADADQKMKALITDAQLDESLVTVLWKAGDPVKQILDASKSEKVDLLLAGALPKENVVNFYLGTVARKIMRKASCSVLMITNPSHEARPLKNVVTSAEDNPCVVQTLQAACLWAKSGKDTWLHVTRELKLLSLTLAARQEDTADEYSDHKQQMVEAEMQDVYKLLEKVDHKGLRINIKILAGKSGHELAQFATRKEADLLVISAPPRKFSLLDRVFAHDQEYIFNELPCNLLVVYGKETNHG